MIELKRQDGISQANLAARVHFSAPTVSVTLQNMEAAGYIVRKPDPNDQRLTRIYLTETGKETEEKIHNCFLEAESELIAPLTEAETEALRPLLERMFPTESCCKGESNPS